MSLGTIPEEMLIVTIDVVALYPSIPHEDVTVSLREMTGFLTILSLLCRHHVRGDSFTVYDADPGCFAISLQLRNQNSVNCKQSYNLAHFDSLQQMVDVGAALASDSVTSCLVGVKQLGGQYQWSQTDSTVDSSMWGSGVSRTQSCVVLKTSSPARLQDVSCSSFVYLCRRTDNTCGSNAKTVPSQALDPETTTETTTLQPDPETTTTTTTTETTTLQPDPETTTTTTETTTLQPDPETTTTTTETTTLEPETTTTTETTTLQPETTTTETTTLQPETTTTTIETTTLQPETTTTTIETTTLQPETTTTTTETTTLQPETTTTTTTTKTTTLQPETTQEEYVSQTTELQTTVLQPQNSTTTPQTISTSTATNSSTTATAEATTSPVTSYFPSQPSTTVTSAPKVCKCRCKRANETVSVTESELKEKLDAIKTELTLSTRNLSSTRRKKESVMDKRLTAQMTGVLGVFLLVFTGLLLVAMDIHRVLTSDMMPCRRDHKDVTPEKKNTAAAETSVNEQLELERV
ncbi:hypothetical protein ACOMHN_045087 [Nucella lapillus]